MRNVKDVTGLKGITVGLRKDGSVAILFSDNSIEWYSPDDYRRYIIEVV